MSRPLHVLLLDTGKEWGGGTNSMLEWLRRRDCTQFRVTCVFYQNYLRGGDGLSVEDAVRAADADFIQLPAPRQPAWAKLSKEVMRGVLHLAPRARARAVELVEFAWRIRPAALRLVGVIRATQPDLIYMNNQPTSNYEGYLAGSLSLLPVVQHCRTYPKLSSDVVNTVNRYAQRVLAVSGSVAAALSEQGVVEDKVQVVFNGIDIAQPQPVPVDYSRELGIQSDVPVFVTVASLLARKGIAFIIRAMAKLNVPVHLVVIGDGPQRGELERLAEQLGIAERIHFVGFIAQPLPWMAASKALLLASESEGFGRVLIEAMYLGKPIIASNVSGCRDIVLNGETGWLFPYGDTSALADRMASILADPQQAMKFGSAGRERVIANFDIDHYVSNVSRILREVVQR